MAFFVYEPIENSIKFSSAPEKAVDISKR